MTPYILPYDGNSHTATASATGVGGVSLPGTDFNLTGTTHTLPGTYSGDAWSFSDPNYTSASGSGDGCDFQGDGNDQLLDSQPDLHGQWGGRDGDDGADGLATVITYSQNGQTVATPTNAGSYTVGVTINDPNYTGVCQQYTGG